MREIPAVYAEQKQGPSKVIFGIPIPKNQQPHPQTVQALRDCVPLVEAAGFEHGFTYTSGNPYISGARAEITRKALDAKADIIVYIDYDVSWDPEDMVRLLKTEGEVVGGTYRCKVPENVYMGAIYTHLEGANEGKPRVRADGCIKARTLPAGFMKVTTVAIDKFMRAYPELCYGPQYSLSVDLFHHGAMKVSGGEKTMPFAGTMKPSAEKSGNGLGVGETMDGTEAQEALVTMNSMLIPNMNIHHWDGDKSFEGNYHEFSKQADINIASSGDNTVITPNADQRVIIWKMWIVGNGAVNLTFKDGSTALNGSAIHLTADGSSMTFPFDGEPYWFTSTAGNAFKINLSGAVQVNGRIYYTLVNP
jgi:hypothetical protein